VRTLIIIDKAPELIKDETGIYYFNERGDKITPSPTSVITYLRFGSMNLIDMQAEIALLKKQLRK
jgi:hypothetical protein